ncbi:MAG: TIM barrel protein [Gemmatimonadaceae bacterium]|nr:TIM barrel protein [Gemmatimonadaceae bacterium]
MDRRQFVRTTAAVAAAAGLQRLNHLVPSRSRAAIPNLGVGLFSVPKLLDSDFSGTIGMLARMGYREVELFGPYDFSAPEAIASWKPIGAQLGFSGSGFFGLSAAQIRGILDQHRMTAPSMHTDLLTLETRMDQLADAAHAVGSRDVVLPAIPDTERRTLDQYRRMADRFNVIGDKAQRAGIRFAYHNHGYGLVPMEGTVPLTMLLERTDPALVFCQMDLYWTVAGGMDPVALLKAHPGRYVSMHVKDMKEAKRFRGDGGDSSQWMELFPYMVSAGDGVMDLRAITTQARASGVRHLFVEQDLVANPDVALKRSYDFLASL